MLIRANPFPSSTHFFNLQSPSRNSPSFNHPPKFFTEPSEEDKAAANAKRIAYKEQCAREVEEFQRTLALEEAVRNETRTFTLCLPIL